MPNKCFDFFLTLGLFVLIDTSPFKTVSLSVMLLNMFMTHIALGYVQSRPLLIFLFSVLFCLLPVGFLSYF